MEFISGCNIYSDRFFWGEATKNADLKCDCELNYTFERKDSNALLIKVRGKITGLIKGSNAETAALKEDMVVSQYNIWNGNTDKPAKLLVSKDGKVDWIEFMPIRKVTVPQVVNK